MRKPIFTIALAMMSPLAHADAFGHIENVISSYMTEHTGVFKCMAVYDEGSFRMHDVRESSDGSRLIAYGNGTRSLSFVTETDSFKVVLKRVLDRVTVEKIFRHMNSKKSFKNNNPNDSEGGHLECQ